MPADRHSICPACRGNVAPGKSCYACGLEGPAGSGEDLTATHEAMVQMGRLGIATRSASMRRGHLRVRVGADAIAHAGPADDLRAALAALPDGAGEEAALQALAQWRVGRG